MDHLEDKIKPPGPANYTVWCRPFRDLPDRERWQIYDDIKHWRYQQELAEVPITEDYREFCCRVCRELEL
ncbi:hypothetical protein ACFQH5_20385 [Halomonas salifodinae]|uniref:Uncharacterized protein n=1 Tax=Halomonas salifodinae TaxID=438745 RepID=A0ABW2F375_9GAMM